MAEENSSVPVKKNILKSSSGMALATLLSRILGLIRVRLESAVLGGGELASGWFLAFAIPNLLRRVLGEGALATALIPLIAESDAQSGKEKVRRQLAVVFATLGALLALIVVLVSVFSWAVMKYSFGWGIEFFEYDHIQLMFRLLPMLMPYGFFICLVGVIGAVLNYTRIFLRPALAALILNVVLLIVLAAALIWTLPEQKFLPLLALSVPLAGALQLVLMLILLWKSGYFPDLRNGWKERDILGRLFRLALPGIAGYAALQVSFLIDRAMAASLGSQAVPALTYVDRIVDIPIGIVAVSLGSVLMAMMSRSAAEGKVDEIGETLAYSLRIVWFITLPIAVLVMFFHNNMLQILCLGGRYTRSDLQAAHWVAVFYGMGIPFFCSLKVILPAFYSRKKMVTVLKVSVSATVINIILNYILMQYLAQGGIALATVAASLVNNFILLLLLKREKVNCHAASVAVSFGRSIGTALFCGYGLYWLYWKFAETWATAHWQNCFLVMFAAGIGMFAGYFVLNKFLRAPECAEIMAVFRRRRS